MLEFATERATRDGLIGTALAEMSFGSPPSVRIALRTAVDGGSMGYASAHSVERLALATKSWLRSQYEWDPPLDGIRPVGDLVAGFRAVLTHFVPPESPVIVPTPGYMPFLSLPPSMRRRVIQVPMIAEAGKWRYDFDGIRAGFEAGAKMLVLCNPHNPIGKMADETELAAIEQIVAEANGLVFADEIHAPIRLSDKRHIVYAARNPRAAAHTITATSASKAFNMPAVKCGQLIFTNPEHLHRWMGLSRWYEYQASALGMAATEAAYLTGGSWLNEVTAHLGETIAEACALLGGVQNLRLIRPEATYLLWIDMRQAEIAKEPNLAIALRDRAGLVVTDGVECGLAGSGFVRFNAALPRDQVIEGMRRLARVAA